MTKLTNFKKQWMKDPKVKKEYDEHKAEFEIAHALLKARLKEDMTQEEVAKKMGTTQSVVARMEGGEQLPSLRSILRYAEAIGRHAELKFVK